MNHCMRRPLYCFKGTFDDMFSCLSQHLDRHIIRNHILFDQSTKELIFCLRRCRETNLDLFESHIYQHLEKFHLFIQTHRLDQRLVPISQIHTAPDRWFLYMILFHPIIALFRWHKITPCIFFTVLHNLLSPCIPKSQSQLPFRFLLLPHFQELRPIFSKSKIHSIFV